MEADELRVYSAMQEGKPFKSYIKTILGKVYVTSLNPFTDQPIGSLLTGDPRKEDPDSIIQVWNIKQDMFFRNMNKIHFTNGTLIEHSVREEERKPTIEESTDEDLKVIVNSRFLALQNELEKINTVPVLFRMLTIAQELEKSDKIVKAIEARLAEVQAL